VGVAAGERAPARRGFHDRLEAGFELVEKLSIPQWEGMYDMLTVWKRR
jgi:hypothetical protein